MDFRRKPMTKENMEKYEQLTIYEHLVDDPVHGEMAKAALLGCYEAWYEGLLKIKETKLRSESDFL